MCEVIETNRLVLRPYEESDLDRQVKLANDMQVLRMTGTMPYPYTEEDARAWLESHERGVEAGTDYPFAICEKEDGLVGAMGLHLRDNGLYELGYWIAREKWGRGMASEAGRAILRWALEKLDLHAVQARVFTDNPASVRVLEKLGFLRTGVREQGYSTARGEAVPSESLIWVG